LEVDVDDVLVTRQHQARIRTRTATDIFGVFTSDWHDFSSHNRPWRKVKARSANAWAVTFTKEKLNRLFFWLHGVKALEEPKRERHQQAKANRATVQPGSTAAALATTVRAISATTAAHQDAQLLLAFFHQFVDFRDWRRLFARRPAPTVWPLVAPVIPVIVSAAAPRAARITRHLQISPLF
jgi:hypothetical protein